jgi:1,4-alpha-glucan branching enzyme
MTFGMSYATSEKYILVLSHDEVVHLKCSMINKMPGYEVDKFANLKCGYLFMFGHAGKKLLFMGQDFAQNREWAVAESIDWHLADDFGHRDIMLTLRKLLEIYRSYPVLYTDSRDSRIFEWVNRNDFWRNTFSYIRRNPDNYDGALLFICNFSPMGIDDYVCGVPLPGTYRRIFSTYDSLPGFGGPDENGNVPQQEAAFEESDGRPYRITFNLRTYESVIVELPAGQDGC